jgi:hypothetical protein
MTRVDSATVKMGVAYHTIYVFGDDVTKPPMAPPGKIAWVEEGMPSVAVIGGC